jgi:hypothetical protein
MNDLLELGKEVQLSHPETWKVMKALASCPSAIISTQAAYAACLLRPIEDDRLIMVREFLSEFRSSAASEGEKKKSDNKDAVQSFCHHGSILAGIMHTGDDEAIALAAPCWQNLDSDAKHAFFGTSPENMTFAYIDFIVSIIHEAAEDDVLRRGIIRQLMSHKGLECPVVQELDFNFGMVAGPHLYHINPNTWSYFADFAAENSEIFEEAGRRLGDSLVMAQVLAAWSEMDADNTDSDLHEDFFDVDEDSEK